MFSFIDQVIRRIEVLHLFREWDANKVVEKLNGKQFRDRRISCLDAGICEKLPLTFAGQSIKDLFKWRKDKRIFLMSKLESQLLNPGNVAVMEMSRWNSWEIRILENPFTPKNISSISSQGITNIHCMVILLANWVSTHSPRSTSL